MRVSVGAGDQAALDSVDLYDLDRYVHGSQHPAWRTLRAEAPVWAQSTPDGARFWSVTRFADVSSVLMDDRSYSSEHGTILAVARGDSAGGRTINLMDQPRHAWVRLPTMRLMSTHTVRQDGERVRENVRRLVRDCFAGGGVHDFAELMLHLPMAAVGEIIGIPRSVWPEIPRWAMAGVAPEDPRFAIGSREETLKKAHYELFAIFTDLIRHRRRHPGKDVVSELLRLDFGGRRMDEQEVLLNCYSFAMGAITTTPHVASHMVLAFIEQPEAWRRLRGSRALIPTAVEEALRWATPTNHLLRRTRVPVRIGGVDLDAGELVCAWTASANRDERVFADPYRFDPARTPNPHLAFGIGAHRCIGGPPAQLVIGLLIEEMVDGVARIEPAGDVSHLRSNFINGITHLPAEFHPVATRRAEVLA